MLKLKLLIYILALAVPFLISPGKAQAAAARCFYVGTGSSAPTEVNCLSSAYNHLTFANDKCYQIVAVRGAPNGTTASEVSCGDITNRPQNPVGQNPCPDGGQRVSADIGTGDCVGGNGQNPIWVYLRAFIRFLSGGVAIVVVLMLVISGIQWTTSTGNPQALQAAKGRIINAIIGLLLFIFMAAILNFLVPGGIIGR